MVSLLLDFENELSIDFSRIPSDEDEDYIDYGEAILAFYASLVELLGRCAPSEETIKMGKSDSIRGRSILRSLVSMDDLEGVLSLRYGRLCFSLRFNQDFLLGALILIYY